jgi:hypothetical protein
MGMARPPASQADRDAAHAAVHAQRGEGWGNPWLRASYMYAPPRSRASVLYILLAAVFTACLLLRCASLCAAPGRQPVSEDTASPALLQFEDQTGATLGELLSQRGAASPPRSRWWQQRRRHVVVRFEDVFASKAARSPQALYFNPGIIMQHRGVWTHVVDAMSNDTRVLLMFRRTWSKWGPCDVLAQYLDGSMAPASDVLIFISTSDASQTPGNWLGVPWREDPRLFPTPDGQLGVSYSVVCAFDRDSVGYKVWQRQGYMVLDDDLMPRVTDVFLPINRNLGFPVAPHYEKNWGFFTAGPHMFVLYSIQPFVVYNVTGGAPVRVANTPWRLAGAAMRDGDLRGGAPPVFVDGHWYAFVHTHREGYTTHVVQFSGDTFTPTAASHVPVVLTRSALVFPCGALHVRQEQAWYISLGEDDERLRIVKVAHPTLLQLLRPALLLDQGRDAVKQQHT